MQQYKQPALSRFVFRRGHLLTKNEGIHDGDYDIERRWLAAGTGRTYCGSLQASQCTLTFSAPRIRSGSFGISPLRRMMGCRSRMWIDLRLRLA